MLHGVAGNFEVALFQSRGFHRLRQQVAQSNLLLFNGRIALEADQLHAVQQRFRDGVGGVGRADEQHVA